jgi:nucleotide-binding universal stress UspA family protein
VSGGRIVIGYNESDEARDALALGRELAEVTDASVLLVAAFPYDSTRIGVEAANEFLEADRRRVFAGIEEELGVPAETRAVGDRSPARALHDVAEAEAASMLVVGSTHRGPIGRVLFGGVGERLLHGAPCPIAVAPRGFAGRSGRSLQRFAVAFDGSPESRRALRHAGELAAKTRARTDVVAVLEPWGTGTPAVYRAAELSEIADIDALDRRRDEEMEARLRDALAELPEPVRGTTVLLHGDPAHEIAGWAEREELDLLVVGSRGYGPAKRVLLGGVSAVLARSAPCPLVVVPRG